MRIRPSWSRAIILLGVFVIFAGCQSTSHTDPSLVNESAVVEVIVIDDVVDPNDPMPVVFRSLCLSCHSMGGRGLDTAAALDGAYLRTGREKLRAWIVNPTSVEPSTQMPAYELADSEIEEILDYLRDYGNQR